MGAIFGYIASAQGIYLFTWRTNGETVSSANLLVTSLKVKPFGRSSEDFRVFVSQPPDRETFHNCLSWFMIFLLHSLGVLQISPKEGMHSHLFVLTQL
jgi:hypothetical protein